MISLPGSIPIVIHPIFWIMAFGIGWLSSNQDIVQTLMWVVVITISILVHEFGHALTAKAFGQKAYIELMGMGGLTRRRGGNLNSFKEFLIVLNGPMAGFLLFFTSSALLGLFSDNLHQTVNYMLNVSIWVNFYWTVLNLLPVYPLDGGQLLRIILEAVFGIRGVKFSLLLSMFIGILLSAFFLWEQQLFVGALFLLLTYESYKAWYSTLEISESDSQADVQQELRDVEQEIQQGDLETAKLKLIGMRDKTGKGVIFLTATKYLAEILNEQGRDEEAYELLKPIESSLTPDGLALMQQLAYKKGDLKKSIELGGKVFQEDPQFETALLNAYAHALLGEARPAVGWIECAEREGLPNAKEVLLNKEFDKIRTDPAFQKALTTI